MHIELATEHDRPAVLAVERAAFGEDDEADLVALLLDDPSARPFVSLLARIDGRPVGHILFTAAHLDGPAHPPPVALLAPMAVVPDAQRQGIGGALIERGVELLAEAGVALVFVLGHPTYYPRHGFGPAGPWGLAAPYPIPDAVSDVWMVRALHGDVLGSIDGTVRCADTLQRPEYWRE